jgi:hypothetical protein
MNSTQLYSTYTDFLHTGYHCVKAPPLRKESLVDIQRHWTILVMGVEGD